MRLRGGGGSSSSSSSRHPNVPSLSTLLISDPPVIVIEDDDPNNVAEPKHYSGISPLLSPVDSHYASSISSSCCSSPHLLSVSQPLPPLQGDDPPKRLKRHPSISSMSSITSNGSSSSSSLITKPTLWHVASPLLSPLLSPSSTTPFTQQQQQQPSTLTSPTSPSAPSACMAQPCRSPSPVATVTPKQDHSRPPLPPATQIIVNEQGETILKRRRGRPPNLREPSEEGGWTFLTPTVWNVKHQQPPQDAAEETRRDAASHQQQPPQEHTSSSSSSIMNGKFAAFSSLSEEHNNTLLQMPRKKRGRKPKTQMAGNSCFVWKDISATRRSTKAMKLAQEQQKQRDYLQDQGSTLSTTTATATRLRRIEQAPPPSPPAATAANTNN